MEQNKVERGRAQTKNYKQECHCMARHIHLNHLFDSGTQTKNYSHVFKKTKTIVNVKSELYSWKGKQLNSHHVQIFISDWNWGSSSTFNCILGYFSTFCCCLDTTYSDGYSSARENSWKQAQSKLQNHSHKLSWAYLNRNYDDALNGCFLNSTLFPI